MGNTEKTDTTIDNFGEQSTSTQAMNLQKVYVYYRLTLSAVLVLLYFGEYATKISGSYKPDLYLQISSAYFLLNLIPLIVILKSKKPLNDKSLLITTIIDITALVLITHSSGGVPSGLGNLLVICVAAASIFFVGSIPTLVAATATISLLCENLYVNVVDPSQSREFLGVALLGILFFATSYFVQSLAQRIRTSQMVAERRAADAASLQRLNNLIVKRMRTGILVTTNTGQIRMMNQSAANLLAVNEQTPQQSIHAKLLERLNQWQQSPQLRTSTFKSETSGPDIQANFMGLEHGGEDNLETLIFLEDTSAIAQQAQQMKLASLGRLTASIAHEIRNPLGAISHAAQLLEESQQLCEADLKLADIIQKHSIRMNQVIENVLQLSRRNRAKPQKFVLKHWLEGFYEDFANTEESECDIRIVVEPEDTSVSVDPSQLGQVITNLCHNGLRYSKKATGKATMLLHAYTNQDSNMPFLDVIDYGEGVTEEARKQLFEPFYTTEGSGTGLGLYISRELCEANQTRLDYVVNDKGKGCFRLSFSHPDKTISII